MPHKSSIDKLPAELVAAINRLRGQGRTIDELMAYLADMNTQISRSALGRHVKGLDEAINRMRDMRIISETLVDKLGDAPGSQQAQVTIEMLTGMIMEFVMNRETDQNDPQGLMQLAKALDHLGRANKSNVDFVIAAEKRAREQAQREAAQAVETVGKSEGLSDSTVEKILDKIFGVKG